MGLMVEKKTKMAALGGKAKLAREKELPTVEKESVVKRPALPPATAGSPYRKNARIPRGGKIGNKKKTHAKSADGGKTKNKSIKKTAP